MNRSIKQMEREEFSLYYTDCKKKALTEKLDIDVAEIGVYTRKTVVRPLHAKSLPTKYAVWNTAYNMAHRNSRAIQKTGVFT